VELQLEEANGTWNIWRHCSISASKQFSRHFATCGAQARHFALQRVIATCGLGKLFPLEACRLSQPDSIRAHQGGNHGIDLSTTQTLVDQVPIAGRTLEAQSHSVPSCQAILKLPPKRS
jgi:hypothetical protein